MDPTPFRTFLTELATASGDFIRPYFVNPDLKVETKPHETVTYLESHCVSQVEADTQTVGDEENLTFNRIQSEQPGVQP